MFPTVSYKILFNSIRIGKQTNALCNQYLDRQFTFADLDKSDHNDENQCQKFSHSEDVLDPRSPAHTVAIHPGEEHFGNTHTHKQSS